MDLDLSLVDALRDAARNGEPPSTLVKLARSTLGTGSLRLPVTVHFRQAFGLPLREAADVGASIGWEDEFATLSDEDLRAILAAYIPQYAA